MVGICDKRVALAACSCRVRLRFCLKTWASRVKAQNICPPASLGGPLMHGPTLLSSSEIGSEHSMPLATSVAAKSTHCAHCHTEVLEVTYAILCPPMPLLQVSLAFMFSAVPLPF
jgi:hypothetical protein